MSLGDLLRKNISDRSKTRFCKVCNATVTIEEKKSWGSHCCRRSHLDALPKHVTVTGFLKDQEDNLVDSYFAQFGEITRTDVHEDSIDFFYNDTTRVIHSHHIACDIPLTLSWQHPRDQSQRTIHITPTNHDLYSTSEYVQRSKTALLKQLNVNGTSCVRIGATLLWQHTLSFRAGLDVKLLSIGADLRLLLGNHATIIPFGSTKTTLNYAGSSVDIYIRHEKVKNDENLVALLKKSERFLYPVSMANGNFPIVKCFHGDTGVWLEFYIKNMIPLFTSSLLEYYTCNLSTPLKLARLLLVLKVWSESRGLRKSGLKSYGLSWLAIFYLQTAFNLPNLHELQRDCQPEHIEGWMCSYCPLADFYNERLDNGNYRQLLAGFFHFYGHDFDFMASVVCPYLGKTVSKVDFMRPATLPPSMHVYKRRILTEQLKPLPLCQGLCVQDPVEHDRNLTADISFDTCAKFTHACALSLEILKRPKGPVLYNVLTQNDAKADRLHTFELQVRIKDGGELQRWLTATTSRVLKCILKCTVSLIWADKVTTFRCKTTEDVWHDRLVAMEKVCREHNAQNEEEEMELEERVSASMTTFKYMPTDFQINMTFKPVTVFVDIRGSTDYKYFNHVKHFLMLKLRKWLRQWEDKSGKPLRDYDPSAEIEKWHDNEDHSLDHEGPSDLSDWSDSEDRRETFTVTKSKENGERRQSPMVMRDKSRSPRRRTIGGHETGGNKRRSAGRSQSSNEKKDASKSSKDIPRPSRDIPGSSKDTSKPLGSSNDALRSPKNTSRLSKDAQRSLEDTLRSPQDTSRPSKDPLKSSEDSTSRSSRDNNNVKSSTNKRRSSPPRNTVEGHKTHRRISDPARADRRGPGSSTDARGRRSRSPQTKRTRSRSPQNRRTRSRSPRISDSSNKTHSRSSGSHAVHTTRSPRTKSPQRHQEKTTNWHRSKQNTRSPSRTSQAAKISRWNVQPSFQSSVLPPQGRPRSGHQNRRSSEGKNTRQHSSAADQTSKRSSDVQEARNITMDPTTHHNQPSGHSVAPPEVEKSPTPSRPPPKKFPVKTGSKINIRLKKDEELMPEAPPPPRISMGEDPTDIVMQPDKGVAIETSKKVEVLSRCQATLCFLSNDPRTTPPTCRFHVDPSTTLPSNNVNNHSLLSRQSPLLKGSKIRFRYTSRNQDQFEMALNRISTFPSALDLQEQRQSEETESNKNCFECKKRSLQTFSSIGVQCDEEDLTLYDVDLGDPSDLLPW